MRSRPALAALAAGILLFGCAPRATRRDVVQPGREETTGASLFPADATILPDDVLARILAHEWSAPERARLAVLRVGQRSPFYRWSDEFARLDGKIREEFLGALRGSIRVASAAELPSLLVPREQSVGHLREAAARFRSDLILAWRADCRSYERFHLFSKDESKAHCDVEAVLLDVRSGVAPFAAVSTRQYATKQAGDELSVVESAHRAELQATGDALLDVARGVVAFLDGSSAAAR